MRILVTGSSGFIGKNLCVTLDSLGYQIDTFDKTNSISDLEELLKITDCVVHLAGVNRTQVVTDFHDVNVDLTQHICDSLRKYGNKAPVILSSSIQAKEDNDYGKSKREGELILLNHQELNNSPVYIYRFSNLFGKWSKPNYNTVIATWCHNISRNLPIQIHNSEHCLTLEYIDDVVQEIIRAINGSPNYSEKPLCSIPTSYTRSLKEISEMLLRFKESRDTLFVPYLDDDFEKKLYSTYLSFLPTDAFSYPLKTHSDERGSFTEFVKSISSGQVSVNISKPGITKGQHWHHTKNEKFLVVKGSGMIQLRNLFSTEVLEYCVSDQEFVVVDIPTGYTHNIINTGSEDLITIMWVNEVFDRTNPDTYALEV